MTNRLSAINLSAGFGQSAVLGNASLELQAEQIIAVAGPNGAGKSTLLKTMARQLAPISGQVLLNEQDIWQLTAREFASMVAYVPQSIEVTTDLTVEEMVLLGRNPHQKWWQWYGTKSDQDAVNAALIATEMQGLRLKPLCQLSGGERQRAT